MKLKPSTRKNKKYMAIFDDGTVTHFGGLGYQDYTTYYKKDPSLARSKRNQYIRRHGATESWKDPKAASTLSRYILWEKPQIKNALAAYKRKFRV